MGMSTHVVGFIPPDEDWLKMKAVWDACREADVTPPEDVLGFFGGEYPDGPGTEVRGKKLTGVSQYEDDARQGFEVELAALPPQVKVLRFVNSW